MILGNGEVYRFGENGRSRFWNCALRSRVNYTSFTVPLCTVGNSGGLHRMSNQNIGLETEIFDGQ